MDKLNEARRQKALDKLYNFDGEIMTLRAYLNTITITRKSVYVQEYATHKVDLEYKKINPKSIYTVWYIKNGSEVGLDVPKLVYDQIKPNIPKKESMLRISTNDAYKAVKDAYIAQGKQNKSLPILTHVAILPAGDGVCFGMTNLEDSNISFSKCNWNNSGFATCVPSRPFRDWLNVTRKITDFLDIEFNKDSETLVIRADNTRAEFKCISILDYPTNQFC